MESKITKSKRDLFRFEGEKPTTINLEHVNAIILDGKRICFMFYTAPIYVDLDSEEIAKAILEQVLSIWAGDQE